MANYSRKAKKVKPNIAPCSPKERSMGRLIVWNVSKAVEKNPQLNLKDALRETTYKLENKMDNVNLGSKPENSEERYLACAVLAWQQLGHASADSLYSFVESKKPPRSSSDDHMSFCQAQKHKLEKRKFQETPYNYDRSLMCGSMLCKAAAMDVCQSGSEGLIVKCGEMAKSPESLPPAAVTEVSRKGFGCMRQQCGAGPVVRLPACCVMRMETSTSSPAKLMRSFEEGNECTNASCAQPPGVEMTCCLEPTCLDRLRELDAMTQELRERSAKLAKREAERVELLERAEASWRNVEQGYQRRLKLAEDEELDLVKQVKYGIDERNGYKNQCTQMAATLRESAEYVEKMRTTLKDLDQQLCDRANKRIHLNQELTKVSATLSDAHSKAWQLDRELQFKEEQAQRKLATMESEISSARALTIETERALRSQLSTLRGQINNISKQLLAEDERFKECTQVVEELNEEKSKWIAKLETCKEQCDCSIKEAEALLRQRQEEYAEIHQKAPTCICQNPVDVGILTRRTPSLAAMCACDPVLGMAPECDCRLMPNALLSNMLTGLFAGLRDELNTIGINMPCPLLKCLDDRHSWESATPAKAAIKTFFTNLLVGELEVAIATSIEKHHAKWVGTSCADEKATGVESKDWQGKVVERRAQKPTTKLFNEKTEKLAEKAQEMTKAGPASCVCGPTPHSDKDPAVYSCLVSLPAKLQNCLRDPQKQAILKLKPKETNPCTRLWKQTQQDVTELKAQVEFLKKAAINKEDLKHMEEKISRVVKSVTVNGKNHSLPLKDSAKATNTEHKRIYESDKKSKKHLDSSGSSKRQYQTTSRKHPQSYAVNVCLCEPEQDPKKMLTGKSRLNGESQKSGNCKQKPSNRLVKPLDISTHEEIHENDPVKRNCVNCNCFNREPSNTSIDKLLDTLAKWKGKLTQELSVEKEVLKTPETTLHNFGFPKELLVPVINNDKKSYQESKKSKQSIGKIVDSVRVTCRHKGCPINNLDFVPQEINTVNVTESELISSINLEKSNEVDLQSKNVDLDAKGNAEMKLIIRCDDNRCATKGIQPSDIMRQQVIDESVQISDSIINSKKKCLANEKNSCSDYEIKLLGVTLAKCDTQPMLKETYKINNHETYYNEESVSREKGKYYKEKALDVPSIEKTSKTSECVCCREDTTEDLEINTFSLIEEFLKKRLQEYKDHSCLSKCLTKEEENKLFCDMLKNIKTTISNTLKNAKCSGCTELNAENDNFRRGYCLLQEYLKLKLKRLQCVCPDKDEKEYLVADIYEKICSQIENDFQRLKNVYSCKRNNINYEKPEKDTNSKRDKPQKEISCNKLIEIGSKYKERANTAEKLNKIVNVPSTKSQPGNKNNQDSRKVKLPKKDDIFDMRSDMSEDVSVLCKKNQISGACCDSCICGDSISNPHSFSSLQTYGTDSNNANVDIKDPTIEHKESRHNKNPEQKIIFKESERINKKGQTKIPKNEISSPVKETNKINSLESSTTKSCNSSTTESKNTSNSDHNNNVWKKPRDTCVTICTCTDETDASFVKRCSCDETCKCHRGKQKTPKGIEEDFKISKNFGNFNNKAVYSAPMVSDNYCSCYMPCDCWNLKHNECNTEQKYTWGFTREQPVVVSQSIQTPFLGTDGNNRSSLTTKISFPILSVNATDCLPMEQTKYLEANENNSTFKINCNKREEAKVAVPNAGFAIEKSNNENGDSCICDVTQELTNLVRRPKESLNLRNSTVASLYAGFTLDNTKDPFADTCICDGNQKLNKLIELPEGKSPDKMSSQVPAPYGGFNIDNTNDPFLETCICDASQELTKLIKSPEEKQQNDINSRLGAPYAGFTIDNTNEDTCICDVNEELTKLVQPPQEKSLNASTSSATRYTVENTNDPPVDTCAFDAKLTQQYESPMLTNLANYCNKVLKNANRSSVDVENKGLTIPYIGYTMDCSSKIYGGACTCYQNVPDKINDTVQNLWENSLEQKSQLSKFSYIMNGLKSTNMDCECEKPSSSATEQEEENPKVHFQEAQVNTTPLNLDITLKVSNNSLLGVCNKNKVDSDDAVSENWYECCSNKSRKMLDAYDDLIDENKPKVLGQYKTGYSSPTDSCACDLVPVCHVKLLMKSLENKLGTGKCTCDALKCSVCPIHSKER